MKENTHTPGPWSQGRTLDTELTRKWTAELKAKNNKAERLLVFANFTSEDQGRGRVLIAACENECDAQLIAAAPELLYSLEKIRDRMKDIHGYEGEMEIITVAIAKAKGCAA